MPKCKSCQAEVNYIKMEPVGHVMPVDNDPHPSGNIVINGRGYGEIQGGDLFDSQEEKPRYISHFATCPNAPSHRKVRRKK